MSRVAIGRGAAVALSVTFCVRVVIGAASNSATFDEPSYITAGYSYLVTGEHRLDRWHPPLALLATGIAVRLRFDLPFEPDREDWARADARRIARTFLYEAADPDAIVFAARMPSVLFGLATVLLVGLWAMQLWGPRAGLFGLALATADPSLIAHAGLATPDVAVTFWIALSMFATWHYLRAPSRWRWAGIWAAVIAGMLTKHVAFVSGPVIAAVVIAHAWRAPDRGVWLRRLARAAGETLGALALVLGIAALIAGTQVFGVFGALAVGVRDQLWHVDHVPSAYLGGEVSRDGFRVYFLAMLLLKLPLGTQALAIAGGAARRTGAALAGTDAAILIAPPVVVLALLTWTRIDLGVRLILPAFPFLFMLAARAATFESTRLRRFAIGAVAATLLSSAAAIPRELSYINEAGRLTGGARYWLSDSNLDWGQDLHRLAAYLDDTGAPPIYLAYFGGGSPTQLGIRHATIPSSSGLRDTADVIRDRDEPLGPCEAPRQLIAISAFRQQGISELHPDIYDWLSRLEPIAEIGASIRVYDITSDPASHVELARLYHDTTPTARCELAHARSLSRAP